MCNILALILQISVVDIMAAVQQKLQVRFKVPQRVSSIKTQSFPTLYDSITYIDVTRLCHYIKLKYYRCFMHQVIPQNLHIPPHPDEIFGNSASLAEFKAKLCNF